jgi:hypothetical protein
VINRVNAIALAEATYDANVPDFQFAWGENNPIDEDLDDSDDDSDMDDPPNDEMEVNEEEMQLPNVEQVQQEVGAYDAQEEAELDAQEAGAFDAQEEDEAINANAQEERKFDAQDEEVYNHLVSDNEDCTESTTL